MFIRKYVKPILILCAILASAGIVYSFTDHYEKHIDSDGYGWIYWEDANTEKTAQAQASVSKSVSNWPFAVNISEYAHTKSKENDSTGQQNQGSFYLYTLRRGGVTFPYEGEDSKTRDKSKKIWFHSPEDIRVHAKAQVCPRRDSDTIEVDVEF